MATIDAKTGKVVTDDLGPVVVTARKINDPPLLEEFAVEGKRYAAIDWRKVIIAGVIGFVVMRILGQRR